MIKGSLSLFVQINRLNFSFSLWQFPQSFDLSPGSLLNQGDPIYSIFSCGCWDCDQHLRRMLVSPRLHNLSNTFWYCSANSWHDWHFVFCYTLFILHKELISIWLTWCPNHFSYCSLQCLIMSVIPEYCWITIICIDAHVIFLQHLINSFISAYLLYESHAPFDQ